VTTKKTKELLEKLILNNRRVSNIFDLLKIAVYNYHFTFFSFQNPAMKLKKAYKLTENGQCWQNIKSINHFYNKT
jgi:hypothetical protein